MRSFLFSFPALALLAIACAPDASTNKPLPICEEGAEGCSRVPRAEKQAPSKSAAPSGDPATPATEDAPEQPTADAAPPPGAADASADAALGTLCTALAQCCKDIEAAGYLPDNCNSVVALKHESACYAQHQQYKNAGDC